VCVFYSKVVFAEEPVHEDEHTDDDDDAEYKRTHASASPAQSVPDDEDESNLYTHKKDAYEDYCTALQWAKVDSKRNRMRLKKKQNKTKTRLQINILKIISKTQMEIVQQIPL
jgi:hypothetical protein